MTSDAYWDPCVHHRGKEANDFVAEYFRQDELSVVLVGGAGFDPRSQRVSEVLSSVCGDRLKGYFIREERPNASAKLHTLARTNDAAIEKMLPEADIFPVKVFGIDNAPVGGRRATQTLNQRLSLDGVTDLVLDCSALSIGVMFPLARYCLHACREHSNPTNFHLMVLDDPDTDASIRSTSCGKPSAIHTFGGGLTLDENSEAARLWLPQLGTGRQEILNLIYQNILPDAVCPILPFPSTNPRASDELIEEYGALFENLSDPMSVSWNVDARDVVYAHEKSPLDLYRAVLNIDDARRRVFSETGGSQLILSPLGSKAVAIGLLLAAMERQFAVVSVEPIEYHLSNQMPSGGDTAELVHLWLHGPVRKPEAILQDAHE
jgi:hypothetical protein